MLTQSYDQSKITNIKRGRRDKEGREAVMRPQVIVERLKELIDLHQKAGEAAAMYGEAIKATAEKAGLNAAAVRKYVKAKAGDDFEEAARKVGQIALLFGVDGTEAE